MNTSGTSWEKRSLFDFDKGYLFIPIAFVLIVFFKELTVNIAENSCYNGTGETYSGRRNFTESGRPCRVWPSMNPPGHNFCRNPGGHKTRPWCYVGPEYDVEYCHIKKCSSMSK